MIIAMNLLIMISKILREITIVNALKVDIASEKPRKEK
jgi:hypothetical protein